MQMENKNNIDTIKKAENSQNDESILTMKIALESAKIFIDLIDELGLSSNLKLIIAKEIFSKAGIEIPQELNFKMNMKRSSHMFKIERSPYVDEVNKMIVNKAKYKDIVDFLKSKGENISKSAVSRYTIRLLEIMENNNPPTEGGRL
jgi:hypothetical protein